MNMCMVHSSVQRLTCGVLYCSGGQQQRSYYTPSYQGEQPIATVRRLWYYRFGLPTAQSFLDRVFVV